MPDQRTARFAFAVLRRVLGQRNFARLGRRVWLESRLDVRNNMKLNGEQLVQMAVARLARDPLVVFDIGANVGAWSSSMVACAKEHGALSRLRLYAFEPAPGPCEVLTTRLKRTAAITRVEEVAVGEKASFTELRVMGELAGSNTLRPMPNDKVIRVLPVGQVAVDDYARSNDIHHVDLLKVDTEGNDFCVLLGAQDMLRNAAISVVQFEYNHRWIAFRRYLKDVFDLVLPLGYRVGKVTPWGIEAYSAWHPELEVFREGNYLAWHGCLPAGLNIIPWWLEK